MRSLLLIPFKRCGNYHLESLIFLSRSNPQLFNSECLYLAPLLGAVCNMRGTRNIAKNFEEISYSLEKRHVGMVMWKSWVYIHWATQKTAKCGKTARVCVSVRDTGSPSLPVCFCQSDTFTLQSCQSKSETSTHTCFATHNFWRIHSRLN